MFIHKLTHFYISNNNVSIKISNVSLTADPPSSPRLSTNYCKKRYKHTTWELIAQLLLQVTLLNNINNNRFRDLINLTYLFNFIYIYNIF